VFGTIPLHTGFYTVNIQCGTDASATWPATCGTYYVSDAVASSVTFAGSIPSDQTTFKNNFATAIVTALNLPAGSVPTSSITLTATRRRSVSVRAGFVVNYKIIPANAGISVSSVTNALVTAANSPALNNALQTSTGMQATGVAVGSNAIAPPAATTTTAGSPPGSSTTPAPVSAAVTARSVSLAQLVMFALAALIAYMY
jgi:hypothetical protein